MMFILYKKIYMEIADSCTIPNFTNVYKMADKIFIGKIRCQVPTVRCEKCTTTIDPDVDGEGGKMFLIG